MLLYCTLHDGASVIFAQPGVVAFCVTCKQLSFFLLLSLRTMPKVKVQCDDVKGITPFISRNIVTRQGLPEPVPIVNILGYQSSVTHLLSRSIMTMRTRQYNDLGILSIHNRYYSK